MSGQTSISGQGFTERSCTVFQCLKCIFLLQGQIVFVLDIALIAAIMMRGAVLSALMIMIVELVEL